MYSNAGFYRILSRVCMFTVFLIALLLDGRMQSAEAQQSARVLSQPLVSMRPLVVRNDRGGLLRERLREIGQLRESGRPVAIKGGVCFSTCTMFLGLPQTCVSPNTTFGFHGPSSYGRPLDPVTFERASQAIARYYPPALQRWYLDKGRYKIRSLYRISGDQIVAMGIREC